MFLLLPALALASAQIPEPPASLWVTGYYAAWTAQKMPVSAIDFGPLSDIVYFALVPTADGRLDDKQHGFDDTMARQIEQATHAAKRKILVCVGGADTGPAYEGAISDANRNKFVGQIVAWVTGHGYDGVDVDMEPIPPKDFSNFQAFVKNLKAALTQAVPNSILTAAANANELAAYPAIQNQFDRINIMTYDYSGTWEGWETWYNAPLYNDGRDFQSNGKPLPCIDDTVRAWMSQGIDWAKIGIGAPFYGDDWSGADGPNQGIQGVKVSQVDYSDIVTQYGINKKDYHWDRGTHCSYLSLKTPDKHFVSFDDERMIKEKVRYALTNHLGGIIIWNLADDYSPTNPPDKQQPLLGALDDEARK